MVLKNTRLVEIFIFSSYYNVNGISMARRYWKIPSSSFEVEAIPPPPSASPPEVGSIASTSQDSEGIFQYLLAMLMPLLQYPQLGEATFSKQLLQGKGIGGILCVWRRGIGKYYLNSEKLGFNMDREPRPSVRIEPQFL